jgi:chromosome segregation ATPase
METEWLTYTEAAERLNVSPHAVRAKANRKGWRRQIGNDGRARVLVALEPRAPDDRPIIARSSPARKAVDPALVNALESHIKTLQGDNDALREQLAASESRSEKLASDYAAREAKSAAELAAAEARTEKLAAELGADLAAERARADKAIAAFADLAERLDALADERARPWWRRLVG